MDPPPPRPFPISAGILFGLGLGGFFDGIVLHQLLQWHHMLSTEVPPDSLANVELNVLWDGLFHASTYIVTVAGLFIYWRNCHHGHLRWPGKILPATLLMGWGIFNVVEGLVNHHVLDLHHVNETVAREQWIYWDIGFLVWGVAMLVGGWYVMKAAQRERPDLRTVDASPVR